MFVLTYFYRYGTDSYSCIETDLSEISVFGKKQITLFPLPLSLNGNTMNIAGELCFVNFHAYTKSQKEFDFLA